MTPDRTVPGDGGRDREPGDDTAAVQAFYGRWAGLYDVVARWTPGVGTMRASAVDALALRPGETVVDVGCGSGANLPYLRERVGPEGTVVGLDVTAPLLARARRRVRDRGWENVHLLRADARRPPLSDADAMIASFVVGMFDDPAAVVDDWCDLLAPGGRLALLNAAPSERRAAAPVNAALEAVTVLSTPPTRKLRYERDLTAHLAESVEAGHGRLRARAAETGDRTFLLGLVRLTAGRVQ